MITYLDACPRCDPGFAPAPPPIGTPEQVPGGTVTSHQCSLCSTAWSVLWDRYGWPVDRLIAPVTPDRAEVNRGALEEAARRDAAA